jgi:hypothetical protein
MAGLLPPGDGPILAFLPGRGETQRKCPEMNRSSVPGKMKILAVAGLVLLLAGCGLGRSEHADDPLYKAGHSDGCWSATSQVPGDPSSITRNDEAWRQSEAYRAGWKSGYGSCRIRDTSGSGAGMPDTSGMGTGPR